jgi:hypothetical protein
MCLLTGAKAAKPPAVCYRHTGGTTDGSTSDVWRLISDSSPELCWLARMGEHSAHGRDLAGAERRIAVSGLTFCGREGLPLKRRPGRRARDRLRGSWRQAPGIWRAVGSASGSFGHGAWARVIVAAAGSSSPGTVVVVLMHAFGGVLQPAWPGSGHSNASSTKKCFRPIWFVPWVVAGDGWATASGRGRCTDE